MSSGGEDGEKPPNHERWVISYADFMTLLFALFVVLFASSSRNRAKMEEEAKGMVAAFHGLTPALIRQQGASKGMMKHQPSPVPKPIENPAPRTPHNEAKPKQSAPVNLPVPPKPHAPAIAPKPAQPMPPPTRQPQELTTALRDQPAGLYRQPAHRDPTIPVQLVAFGGARGERGRTLRATGHRGRSTVGARLR
jgi:flagellar motor protein MotB